MAELTPLTFDKISTCAQFHKIYVMLFSDVKKKN